jgi:beta-barrel assembly-enhancing protease
LSAYVSGVGASLARVTHRRQMPYRFAVVNATYVNAYAFPGGSIAITRGILAELDNEAELAGLLGHELGHVNARHTAARMSKSKILGTLVGGASLLAGTASESLGNLAGTVGGLGASLFWPSTAGRTSARPTNWAWNTWSGPGIRPRAWSGSWTCCAP